MDDILTYVREKISCPQFGDNHYGEWGALPLTQRKTIKRLLDYSFSQEEVINLQKAEIEKWKKNCDELYEQMSERLKAELEIERRLSERRAIKEFADRLYKRILQKYTTQVCTTIGNDMDDIAKEMEDDVG